MKTSARNLIFIPAAAMLALAASTSNADLNVTQFQDVTEVSGFYSVGETWGNAIGDIDSDGYPDVFIGQHGWTPTTVLHNRGDGTFENVIDTPKFGDYNLQKDSHSVAFGDLNNDGKQEIVEVQGVDWDNEVWIQDSAGNYQTHPSGLGFDPADHNGLPGVGLRYPDSWPALRDSPNPFGRRSPIFFDFDQDGLLDMFVSARVGSIGSYQGNVALFRQTTHPDTISNVPYFEFVDEADTDLDVENPITCDEVQYHDLTGDGKMELMCSETSQLTAVFEVSDTPPYLRDIRSEIGEELFSRWPYDKAVGDFDGDGRNDVFTTTQRNANAVALQVDRRTLFTKIPDMQDTGISFNANGGDVFFEFSAYTPPSEIFIGSNAVNPPWSTNIGIGPDGGHRVQLTLSASDSENFGIASDKSERGFYVGFVNGRWQVFINNSNTQEPGVTAKAGNINTGLITDVQSIPTGAVSFSQGSMLTAFRLYTGNEAGQFDEVTFTQFQNSCSAIVAGDFDNDMDLDVFAGCTGILANIPNVLLENDGDGNFTQVAGAGGAIGDFYDDQQYLEYIGRMEAVMTLDYDRDGCLDLVAINSKFQRPFSYSGRQRLYKNLCNGNNWAEIRLEGVQSNRDGIGATVYATTPDGTVQMREMSGGTHYHAQDDTMLHFGLAQETSVDMRVVWPDGTEDLYDNVPINQVSRLIQGGGTGLPNISISNATPVSENAGPAVFEVRLSSPSTEVVTVDYNTADGSAEAGSDYDAVTNGLVSFPIGTTSQNIEITLVNDSTAESEEDFTVTLSNQSSNAAISNATATGTIQDDDTGGGTLPTISISDATAVSENAGPAVFEVTLSSPSTELVTVDYNTADGSAVSGSDYDAVTSGLVSFPIGSTSQNIEVTLVNDSTAESEEDFTVTLSSQSSNATILAASATGTIQDDDTGGTPPTISISDATPVSESAGPAVFEVTLSSPSTELVTVDYNTADGSAVSGSDYDAVTNGLVSFPIGSTSQNIEVTLVNDSVQEDEEAFTVTLTNQSSNATILAGSATGTIQDDDGTTPTCGAPDINSTTERGVFLWNDCADQQQWHLRVTAAFVGTSYRGSVTSNQLFDSLVGFSIEASDSLPADFNTPTSGPIPFILNVGNAGQDGFEFHQPAGAFTCFDLTSPTLPVWIGSNKVEVTEPVNLTNFGSCETTGTTLSVANITVDEDVEIADFTVNLLPAPGSGEQVDVSYSTANGTATNVSDYAEQTGVLIFNEGVSQLTVSVPIVDDTESESTEAFSLVLSSATTNSATATATILDNDGGSSPLCGEPAFDRTTERAVFLWNDCIDPQQWHARVTAGGFATSYRGSITSDQPFDSLVWFSIEASDSLPAAFPNPTAGPIDFILNVGNSGQDGFEFKWTGSNTCFELDSPALPVLVGANRVPVTVPVNLSTFGACVP